MEEVCIKKVWTGSCVSKGFGLVNKEFFDEVFVVVMDYFDERFGFDESFDGTEFLDKRSKTTG